MDWTVILVDVGQAVIPWIATFVLGLLGKYVYSKIENETWRGIATRATAEVFDAAQEIHQTYVKQIKKGREDGKLTDGEKAAAKKAAVDTAKANLGMKGFTRLAKVIGGANAAEKYLATKVESAVSSLKAADAVAEAPKQ